MSRPSARRLLARPGLIRALAPHDVFTARVVAQAGVELLFLGGFGVSASRLGLPDVGLTTLTEMVDALRPLTERVPVPVIADGDTGHGDLHNVARTVREFERAGAAGILLEDQVAPKRCGHFAGKQVISRAAMVDKLRVALDTRLNTDFVIVARTDARAIEGLDAAIERACRYAEVGVDLGFVEAPRSGAELARIAREVPMPQMANMLPGGETPLLTADELATLGFKIVVDPISTLLATGYAVRRLAAAWLADGSLAAIQNQLLPFEEVKRLLGLDEILALADPRPIPPDNCLAAAASPPTADADAPWRNAAWVALTQRLLDSYARWMGRQLIPRDGTPTEQAQRLFEAPRVVVAHGSGANPIFNYANRAALTLWETDLPTILATPSRQTAEPVHRDERARLLERTRRDGYVDDYRGVRVSTSGRRFLIERAVVWNVVTPDDQYLGQAATFDAWTHLGESDA